MIQIKGKYNDCKIFVPGYEHLEDKAYSLIYDILSNSAAVNPIRIMPDTHWGKGTVVGFTMEMAHAVSPEWVGVDIGCGMASVKFHSDTKLDLNAIERNIRQNVPMGFSNRTRPDYSHLVDYKEAQQIADKFTEEFNTKYGTNYSPAKYDDKWLNEILKKRINCSPQVFMNAVGSLGGGNHFIELGQDEDGYFWVTVHSGSRNFGAKVCAYWSNIAKSQVPSKNYQEEKIAILSDESNKKDRGRLLKELKEKYDITGKNESKTKLLYEERLFGYLMDMIFAQRYALWNRKAMLEVIQKCVKFNKKLDEIHCIHNYIDFRDMVVRKGAISSYKGERGIIPFNMRDGILITEGKSNEDWNNSAPHGAGRIMSRTQAKNTLSLEQFKKDMEGICSTSVVPAVLDESPRAYKDPKMIEIAIEPTAEIVGRIKPLIAIKDKSKSKSWKEIKNLRKNKS